MLERLETLPKITTKCTLHIIWYGTRRFYYLNKVINLLNIPLLKFYSNWKIDSKYDKLILNLSKPSTYFK